MAWLALLATLVIEQAVALPAHNPVYSAAQLLSDATARQFNAGRPRHGMYAWFALVGAAALLSGAAYLAARSVHALAALAVDVGVLYFTFGFRQFSHPLTQIQAALEAGDTEGARQQLVQLKRRTDPSFLGTDLAAGEIARQAIESGLLAAHRHVFGVLFWFVLLPGPAGAVLYRLSDFVSRRWNPRGPASSATLPPDRFGEFAQRIFQWIDWMPARLTALAFAVVGDFEGAVDCWRRLGAGAAGAIVASRALILGAAGGALGFRVLSDSESARLFATSEREGPELGEPSAQGMRSAVGLVWRALVLWMILLLLLTVVATLG